MKDHRFMPRRARIYQRRERWQLFVIGLASLYEGVVAVLSLGYLTVDTRSWVLFSIFGDD